MNARLRLRRLLPLLVFGAATAAQAHPGHGPMDLRAGFVHPLTGLDHLLAMVAVGLWAVQLGGKARWLLPAAFVGAMIAGAAVGLAGFAPAGVDRYILATVFVLGALVAAAARLPLATGFGLVALAGFFHGAAHGAEMPLQANALEFLVGMVIATALLHAAAVAAASLAVSRRASLIRWAGAGVLAGGLVLLLR
jgi:urease accessory protein